VPPSLPDLCADLRAEHEDLDGLVATLPDDGWKRPTPAEGWSIRDQIGHLAFFDDAARTALVDPQAFDAHLEEFRTDPVAAMERTVASGRELSVDDLLEWWRRAREELLAALDGLDPDTRIPWYGPPMGARSFVSARLMETWAHGQDVVDALGARRPATHRLRHIAEIGMRTRGWSYIVRGMEPPEADIRVELAAPGGETWEWGDPAAENRVRGDALDFCLVVIQRRHVDDTALEVSGPLAEEWMSIAQAFAGGPGEGRKAGEFAR